LPSSTSVAGLVLTDSGDAIIQTSNHGAAARFYALNRGRSTWNQVATPTLKSPAVSSVGKPIRLYCSDTRSTYLNFGSSR
jgi:hypothetical protein